MREKLAALYFKLSNMLELYELLDPVKGSRSYISTRHNGPSESISDLVFSRIECEEEIKRLKSEIELLSHKLHRL